MRSARRGLTLMGWKPPLDRRLRPPMASRPFQFAGVEERNRLKSELLRWTRCTPQIEPL